MSSVAERVATPPAADLVAFAKDVIAGRVVPPPIPVTPRVRESLDELFGPSGVVASAKYIRRQADLNSLVDIYNGVPVLTFANPDESLAVLAVGVDEIRTVLASLTPAERSRVVMKTTHPG